MKTILMGAAVVWCIGFAVIVALSYRKLMRQRKIDQIRSVVQCCDEYEGRRA